LSDIDYQEANQIKWVGVRPAHNGTQVIIEGTVANGNNELYAVPATATLLLDFFTIDYYAGAIGSNMWAEIRNAADVHQYYLGRHDSNRITDGCKASNLWPPLEIPAGYDINLFSSGAARAIYFFGKGILIYP
jgi:hypothetical protein